MHQQCARVEELSASSRPLVTVAIPTHCRPQLLSYTLASVQRQTYLNLEIVVSDNNSKDATYEVVTGFLDNRIKYHPTGRLLSVDENFNACLSLATGHYFMWLSDDDLIAPNYIEEMVLQFAREPATVVGLAHRINFTESNKQPDFKPTGKISVLDGPEFLEAFFAHDHSQRVGTIASLFSRTETIRSIGGFPILPNGYYSDTLLLVRLATRGKVMISQNTAFYYRCHEQSTTVRSSASSCIEATKLFWREIELNEKMLIASVGSSRRWHLIIQALAKYRLLHYIQKFSCDSPNLISYARTVARYPRKDSVYYQALLYAAFSGLKVVRKQGRIARAFVRHFVANGLVKRFAGDSA